MPFIPETNFRRTPVTLSLVAIILAIELASVFRGDSARLFLYNDLRMGIWHQIWNLELWRPLTTTLLHGNPIHALFNVWWLFVFGTTLENQFGSYRYLGLVLLLAYAPVLAEYAVWQPLFQKLTDSPSEAGGVVGFSGVNYGFFGLVWVGRQYVRDWWMVCDDSTVSMMLFWLFFCIFTTYAGIMSVANIAHFIGLALGFLLGKAIFDARRREVWTATAMLLSVLLLSTLFRCPWHPHYQGVQRGWRSQLPAGGGEKERGRGGDKERGRQSQMLSFQREES